MILSNKRKTKALIRLCGCAGWFVPVLFANPRRQVFSRRGPCAHIPITAHWDCLSSVWVVILWHKLLIHSQSIAAISLEIWIHHMIGKQCRTRSAGFIRSQLICLYTVCKRIYMDLDARNHGFVGLITIKLQTCASIWLAPLLLEYWKYYKLATSKFSIFWLVSVTKETCLSLALSETLKTGFVATRPMLCEPCAYKFNYGTSENGTMFSIHMLEVKSSDKLVHKCILKRDITVWTHIVLK